MKDVRWAALSRSDMERIDLYYRAIDPELAQKIGTQILSATRLLSELPLAGPVAVQGDRRKWRVAGTPYIVFYRIADTHIRILRILHSARDQNQ